MRPHTRRLSRPLIFFFPGTAPSEIYTLSLHDALPICVTSMQKPTPVGASGNTRCDVAATRSAKDRKSTRLNSSHVSISYAVFCLKKKKKTQDSRSAMQNCRHCG